MSFEMRRAINNVEVREGAEITAQVSTQTVLGQHIQVGAVCESLRPESWRSVITANGRRVWSSAESTTSFEQADRIARQRLDQSIDRALRKLFADEG